MILVKLRDCECFSVVISSGILVAQGLFGFRAIGIEIFIFEFTSYSFGVYSDFDHTTKIVKSR